LASVNDRYATGWRLYRLQLFSLDTFGIKTLRHPLPFAMPKMKEDLCQMAKIFFK